MRVFWLKLQPSLSEFDCFGLLIYVKGKPCHSREVVSSRFLLPTFEHEEEALSKVSFLLLVDIQITLAQKCI